MIASDRYHIKEIFLIIHSKPCAVLTCPITGYQGEEPAPPFTLPLLGSCREKMVAHSLGKWFITIQLKILFTFFFFLIDTWLSPNSQASVTV